MSVPKEYPSKEITVKVNQQEQMTLEAYESATPGLVVHRQVRWSPGKGEHKFTSKWQVTHESSGLGLLTPAKCLPRMKDGLKFARRLKDVRDWVSTNADELTNDDTLLNAVKGIYEGIQREQEAEEAGEVVVDEDYSPNFIIQRNRDDHTYEVVNSKTKEVVESHRHRGRAWKAAHTLNEQASV